jgi:hypothetical protein
VLVFQSHAQLTSFVNGGIGEIYRYDSDASPGEAITCVSCGQTDIPPAADAMLEVINYPTVGTTLVTNVTDDGTAVFFQTVDRLMPEDVNNESDVYEWMANGTHGCERHGGCLGLISSGQSEDDSHLYGMTADGRDVFFRTDEKLAPADVSGSSSIYDARVEGGIPAPDEPAACQGDACQGQPSPAPAISAPASVAGGAGNAAGERPAPAGTTRSLTRGQRLARALKACKQKPRRKRRHCELEARKRLGKSALVRAKGTAGK